MVCYDRKLFWRYLFSSVLILVSLVTLAVAWGHWEYTLNSCSSSNSNCGCILFGVVYSAGFSGGSIQYCQFSTFVQVPIFLISVAFVFFYGYRTFIKQRRTVSKEKRLIAARKGGDSRVLDSRPTQRSADEPSVKTRWITLVSSVVVLLLLLAAAAMVTAGFYSSCTEYRKLLVHELALSGNAAQVVGTRMYCGSVFDFLDYLQPDRVNYDAPYMQYSRKDRINTGVTLYIAKTALFMNFINWIFITFFNLKNVCQNGCCQRSG